MYVFIDDSNQRVKGKGCIKSLGSIWGEREDIINLENILFGIRLTYRVWSEFNWNSLDKTHFDAYKEVIKSVLTNRNIRINIIIWEEPTREEVKQYYHGSCEEANNKSLFSLIYYNWLRYKNNYCSGKNLDIIADEPFLQIGNKKDELIEAFNGRTKVPINTATKAKSYIVGCLQIADLFTGICLSHMCNLYFPQEHSLNNEQNTIIEGIRSKFDIKPKTFGYPTPDTIFNVWFYRPGLSTRIIQIKK